MVRRFESSQSSEPKPDSVHVPPELDGTQGPRGRKESTPLSSPNLANTPFPPSEGVSLDSSLTQLESTLRVATTSRTQLPELLSAHDSSREQSDLSNSRSNEDNDSSIYEVPALPSGEAKVRFLADLSEAEKTAEEVSHVDLPLLYGNNPVASESGTEGGDEMDSISHEVRPSRPSSSTVRRLDDGLPELSGRSRALLKTYVDEAKSFNLPLGHPTVVFSESQMYHLLRIMADETLSMSYTTMERMVLDAVKGTPAAVPSRTDQLLLKTRASTPFRDFDSDSSDGESATRNVRQVGVSDSGESCTLGDISIPEESDSSEEMALISQSFKNSRDHPSTSQTSEAVGTSSQGKWPDQDCSSSGDATLSEVRDLTLKEKRLTTSKDKLPKKSRSRPQRGVPMREEFFAKIGWTRSFISGPADPLHNPYMVWCHMCKKNISIRSKGTMEILRHHRTERHLQRDQRWRYEHLRSVDPVTNKLQHRVRGRNGKLLTKIELARELPKFIHTELVDVGERFPFYHDFVEGRTTALVTRESRARTQLRIIGDFIQRQGDFSILRS